MPGLRDNLNLFVRQFAVALQRATRLQPESPEATGGDSDAALARASTRHLPGAGWLLGLVAALVFALVALVLRVNPLGPLLAALASTLAVLLLTGAAQESALFRAAEALGSREGGVGHGVIALVMLLLARVAALAALGSVTEAGVLAALFAAPVVSRFAPLVAAYWLAGDGEVDRATLQVAALWTLPPLLLMLLAGGVAFTLVALLACGAAWVAMLRLFRRRPGAFGADRAGSLQQACEAAFYLGSAAAG